MIFFNLTKEYQSKSNNVTWNKFAFKSKGSLDASVWIVAVWLGGHMFESWNQSLGNAMQVCLLITINLQRVRWPWTPQWGELHSTRRCQIFLGRLDRVLDSLKRIYLIENTELFLLNVAFSFGQVCGYGLWLIFLWFLVTYLIPDISYMAEREVVKKLKITLCCHHMSQLGGGQPPNFCMFLPTQFLFFIISLIGRIWFSGMS